VRRAPGQTSREFLAAAAPAVPAAAGGATTRLVALFELARYGSAPVGEAERAEAIACLRTLEAAS
jgi:hypothetical protein